MHFHFPFTVGDVLWTLTFAAHLVLLVVLLGRDRIKNFPFFTASIVLGAFRLLIEKLLNNRLPQLTFVEIMLVTLTIGVVLGFLVVLELARRAFGRVARRTWVIGALVVMAMGAVVLWQWGPWPSWEAVKGGSAWQLLQLLVQKGSRFVDLETIAVGLLIVALGGRFGAGWRSHTQRIMIGLSTASIAELAVQGTWESIVRAVRANPSVIRSFADQKRIIGLGDKLSNANEVVFITVLVWWIVCLWFDEPGIAAAAPEGKVIEGEMEPVALEPVPEQVAEDGDENEAE